MSRFLRTEMWQYILGKEFHERGLNTMIPLLVDEPHLCGFGVDGLSVLDVPGCGFVALALSSNASDNCHNANSSGGRLKKFHRLNHDLHNGGTLAEKISVVPDIVVVAMTSVKQTKLRKKLIYTPQRIPNPPGLHTWKMAGDMLFKHFTGNPRWFNDMFKEAKQNTVELQN